MPREKSEDFDQNKYVQKYIKENVVMKKAGFNKQHDADVLEWLERIPESFASYVKRLIRDDMAKFS